MRNGKQEAPVTNTRRNNRTVSQSGPPIIDRRRSNGEDQVHLRRRAADKQQEQEQVDFGVWLLEARTKAGRTQEQCCEAMKDGNKEYSVIMAKSDWSRIENGHLSLSNLYDKIPAMAAAVRVSPLLMYQKAYLTPPVGLAETEPSAPRR